MRHVELPVPVEADARIERLERRLERERRARLEAEAIAEKGLRDLYESQQLLGMLQRITDGANRSSDVKAALDMALEEICSQMGWDFGNAYLVETASGEAVACDTWQAAEPDKLFAFVEASRTARFASGVGLPGRVLRDGTPHWIADAGMDHRMPRRSIARKCGLTSGCAFPVTVESEVVALIEFFSRKPVQATDTLLATMAQVGTQLGRVVERERSRRALLHDALHDSLTGLPNRVLLAERCNLAFAHLPPDKRGMAVLVIDLDGFKAVNDKYGHQAGDALIVEVARRLEDCVTAFRQEPLDGSPGWHATVSRTGGDEFVVLLDGHLDRAFIGEIAERLHDSLRKPYSQNEDVLSLAASIGVAESDASHHEVDQVLRDADLAMYEAKSEGSGRTVFFTQDLGAATRSRRELEHQLRDAIRDGQFLLHYQPIFDLGSGHELAGYEALVRWNHPSRGLLSPGDFLEVAEESGLIIFLGNWVLLEAARAIGRLHARRPALASRFVSINVAPQQFLQPNFTMQIRNVLMETGVDPSAIRLEITENVAIMDPARTSAVVSEIREWGVRTSLDDFGTGYSSLSYLQNLPFDALKIDRSFVSSLDDPKCRSIVKAILDLAQSMNLSVVAEGVESPEQCELLASMGCQLAQGYLYGRPMSEKQAFAL